jgi:type II secretory pathway pseudopilin PulG
MKIEHKNGRVAASGRRAAFTLIEVMAASGLAGIMFVSVFAGLTGSFQMVQINRESLRASQILLEKMELIRLYNWNQVTGADSTTFVPATFSGAYYPDGSNGGVLYSGTVTIANAPITETYASDLRVVTISLNWTSGNVPHTRSMTTYVSKYGLQNYLY